jgi:enolase-phosphatase E1
MNSFLKMRTHEGKVKEQVDETRRIANIEGNSVDEVASVLIEWIDSDRKETPLKALQGMIWEQGYRDGAFTAQVYSDVVNKLRVWHEGKIPLYVYSSGSVMAQKLLFGHTQAGDLTSLFSGFFDTTLGSKLETSSYIALAQRVQCAATEILFLSDSKAELDAAHRAGFQVLQVFRDGQFAGPDANAIIDFTPLSITRIS